MTEPLGYLPRLLQPLLAQASPAHLVMAVATVVGLYVIERAYRLLVARQERLAALQEETERRKTMIEFYRNAPGGSVFVQEQGHSPAFSAWAGTGTKPIAAAPDPIYVITTAPARSLPPETSQ